MLSQDKNFLFRIIKWSLIGLLVRIAIMPFSMDTDILWINYIPHQLVANGHWDPYSFARDNFAGRVLESRNPYYPPLAFYMLSFFQFVTQKFMPGLNNWFLQYEIWLKAGGGYALGHVSFSDAPDIFRILFLLKLPLLIFDFGIGMILLRLASGAKNALFVFKLWMLNPIVLHSAYASGQIDIYPTFFVMLAVLMALYKRPYLAVFSLTLGMLIKCYPVIFIPIAIVYLSKTIKEAIKLSALVILTLVLFYLPTLIASGGYSLVSIYPGGTIGTSSTNALLTIMKFCFLISIVLLLLHIYKKKKKGAQFSLQDYFLLTLLLFFGFQPIGARFYIWITPFLFLQFTRDKQLWKLSLIQFLALIELRLFSRALWLGLFAPLHPAFFNSLPIPDSFFNQFLDVTFIHKIIYRLFIILTLYMAYRTYRQFKLCYER